MSDLLGNVRRQRWQKPMVIKYQEKKQNTSSIYCKHLPTRNLTSSLPPLLGRMSSDNDILHLLTSLALCHFDKKITRVAATSYCVDKKFTSWPQSPATATCWASSFYTYRHIKALLSILPTFIWCNSELNFYKTSTLQMSMYTPVPLLCPSKFHLLL